MCLCVDGWAGGREPAASSIYPFLSPHGASVVLNNGVCSQRLSSESEPVMTGWPESLSQAAMELCAADATTTHTHTHTMSFSQLTGLYWIVVLCFSPCSVTINLFCVTSPAYRRRLWDIKDGLFFLFEITLLAFNAAVQHNAPNIRTFSFGTERIRLVDVNRTAGTLYFFSILARKMSLLNALIASCKSIY